MIDVLPIWAEPYIIDTKKRKERENKLLPCSECALVTEMLPCEACTNNYWMKRND